MAAEELKYAVNGWITAISVLGHTKTDTKRQNREQAGDKPLALTESIQTKIIALKTADGLRFLKTTDIDLSAKPIRTEV